MSLLISPTLYFILSFLGFVAVVYRYSYKPLTDFIDAYIAKTRQTIEQAEHQKNEMQQALQRANEKWKRTDQEIEAILESAQKQCETLRHNIQAEILAVTTDQEYHLQMMITKMRQDFIYQLNDQIADKLIKSLKEWMDAHQNTEIQSASCKQAVTMLEQVKSQE
jgi:F0F1-type ATP synthase membrane subunit b/b'